MWTGGIAIACVVGYLSYWNIQMRQSDKEFTVAYHPDGHYQRRERKSRWEWRIAEAGNQSFSKLWNRFSCQKATPSRNAEKEKETRFERQKTWNVNTFCKFASRRYFLWNYFSEFNYFFTWKLLSLTLNLLCLILITQINEIYYVFNLS